MVVVKHQEPELVKKKKKHHPETEMAVISDEIFSSLKDYALQGVENEVTPDKKKPKTEILADI